MIIMPAAIMEGKKDRLRIQILNFSSVPIAIIATVVVAALVEEEEATTNASVKMACFITRMVFKMPTVHGHNMTENGAIQHQTATAVMVNIRRSIQTTSGPMRHATTLDNKAIYV